MDESLAKAVAATWELCGGASLGEGAKLMLLKKLDQYSPDRLRRALDRCLSECRGRIVIGDITSRIKDDRPGPEEAWAEIPKHEADSTVWTDEQRISWGVAAPLLEQGDRVAARLAFVEKYRELCIEARLQNRPVDWVYSPGTDAHGRAAALVKAVNLGRLTPAQARKIEPCLPPLPGEPRALPPKDQSQIAELVGGLLPKMGV
jgi:hypothetical protein